MALPQDGQNANGLTKVTEIPKGKELIFIDPTTNEGGIITLEDLTTQILKNLTSQTFALNQGNMTLLAALNQLNSKALESEVRICGPGKAFEKALRNNKIVLIFISTLDNSNVKSTGFGIVATRGTDNYSGKYTEFFPIDSDVIVSLDGNNLKINSSNNWLRANIITL